MGKFIPLSVPNFKGNELKYVTDAITKEWVSTGGEYINLFEKNISKYLKVKDAVACQSGTAGLHLSLLLSEVEKNDEVIVPALTFIAAVNPVKYIGAEPVFMDCDDSLCIDASKVRRFCENECDFINGRLINRCTGKFIKAIVVVHVFGNNANMETLMNISNEFNLKVIEDATEALGTRYIKGRYKDKYLGTIGDFGVYSFNGNKIITTGGGGMIVSNNEELLKKARYLSTQAKTDEVYYVHDEVGYNYRMTNLQAALGLAQLEQLDEFIEIKRKNYNLYKELFIENSELELIEFNTDIESNYWFYSLYIRENFKFNRDELIKYLYENNIQSRPIWDLIYKQKPYYGTKAYEIERATEYLERVVNIPCSTNLSSDEVRYIASVLNN